MNVEGYVKALFGVHAIHAPVKLVVQEANEGLYVAVLVTDTDLSFGSEKTHQLILGDVVVRPHIVVETNAFRGHGLTSLATTSMDGWRRYSKVLMNPGGRKL